MPVMEVTVKIRYETGAGYGEVVDPQEMAAIDQEQIEENPEILHDIIGSQDYTVEVKPV